jgi:hypothetical protein
MRKLAAGVERSPRAQKDLAGRTHAIAVKTGGGDFGLHVAGGRLRIEDAVPEKPDFALVAEDPTVFSDWVADGSLPMRPSRARSGSSALPSRSCPSSTGSALGPPRRPLSRLRPSADADEPGQQRVLLELGLERGPARDRPPSGVAVVAGGDSAGERADRCAMRPGLRAERPGVGGRGTGRRGQPARGAALARSRAGRSCAGARPGASEIAHIICRSRSSNRPRASTTLAMSALVSYRLALVGGCSINSSAIARHPVGEADPAHMRPAWRQLAVVSPGRSNRAAARGAVASADRHARIDGGPPGRGPASITVTPRGACRLSGVMRPVRWSIRAWCGAYRQVVRIVLVGADFEENLGSG